MATHDYTAGSVVLSLCAFKALRHLSASLLRPQPQQLEFQGCRFQLRHELPIHSVPSTGLLDQESWSTGLRLNVMFPRQHGTSSSQASGAALRFGTLIVQRQRGEPGRSASEARSNKDDDCRPSRFSVPQSRNSRNAGCLAPPAATATELQELPRRPLRPVQVVSCNSVNGKRNEEGHPGYGIQASAPAAQGQCLLPAGCPPPPPSCGRGAGLNHNAPCRQQHTVPRARPARCLPLSRALGPPAWRRASLTSACLRTACWRPP